MEGPVRRGGYPLIIGDMYCRGGPVCPPVCCRGTLLRALCHPGSSPGSIAPTGRQNFSSAFCLLTAARSASSRPKHAEGVRSGGIYLPILPLTRHGSPQLYVGGCSPVLPAHAGIHYCRGGWHPPVVIPANAGIHFQISNFKSFRPTGPTCPTGPICPFPFAPCTLFSPCAPCLSAPRNPVPK
jgi:hypothetical protein